MQSFAIVNATVILPDRVLDGGAVLVRDGLIAEVAPAAAALAERPAQQIDAEGAYLLPGIVDLHNDGYEFELNPAPGANIPPPLAFAIVRAAAGLGRRHHRVPRHLLHEPPQHRPLRHRRRARQHLHRRSYATRGSAPSTTRSCTAWTSGRRTCWTWCSPRWIGCRSATSR